MRTRTRRFPSALFQVPALFSIVLGLSLAASSAWADGGKELERFHDHSQANASTEAAPAVCEVEASGGRAGVAERDVAAVQQAIADKVEREMKPGTAGVKVDPETVLLNGRGHNYAPTRSR